MTQDRHLRKFASETRNCEINVKTLLRHWADIGQTLGRHWAEIGDFGQTYWTLGRYQEH